MPGFDQTGPRGMGPRTGRGFGPCCVGFGLRRGFGQGRGLGRYFNLNAPQSKEDKIKALKEYKQALAEELEDLDKEVKEVENE